MHIIILSLPLLVVLIHEARGQAAASSSASPYGGSLGPQCSSLDAFLNACETLTPSFTLLAPDAQATCFCNDDQGNFAPDSFDEAALGCYQEAETSDTALAAELSSAGLIGFCTNNGPAASPSAAMTSGTFPSKEASSSPAITEAGSTPNKPTPAKTGAEGVSGATKSPMTSNPTPTTTAKSPSPSANSNKSSEACLWNFDTYFSAAVSFPKRLTVSESCCMLEMTDMGLGGPTLYARSYSLITP